MNRREQFCRLRVCTVVILVVAGTTWLSSAKGEDAKAPLSISEWKSQILRWKQDLRIEPIKPEELAPHEAAVEKLSSITDPLAASVLGELLDAEDYVLIKARLIPCLANIPGNPAAKVLVKVCVEERCPILSLAAAKAISGSEQRERAIPYFVKYLERPQHRDQLAYILPKTGLTDFADEALPDRLLFEALVKNLVTKDIWWMPGAGWGLKDNGRKRFDSTKTRDTSTISGKRLHQQSDPLVKQAVEGATPVIEEEGIRQVLVSWTGEDFGFDQAAWRNWHGGRTKELAKALPAEKKGLAGKSPSAEWTRKIAQWQSQLRVEPTDEERAAHLEATEALAALRDPTALPAIEKALAAEKYSGIQLQLLPAIRAIGGKEAIRILVKYACEPASETLRQKAAQLIAEMPNRDEAIPQFVRYLRGEKFQQNAIDSLALTGVTNYRSSQLPHPQLFAALVDCLFTREYEYKEGEFAFDTGLDIRPGISGGLHWSRAAGTVKATVKVAKPKQQPLVSKMLKDYSQQDYGYESSQWKKWLQEEQRRQKK